LHEPTRQARRRRRRRRNRSDQASHCSVAVPHPADLGSIGIGSQQAPSPPPAPSSRAGPAAAGPARSRPRPRQGARPPPVPDWRTARPSPRPGGGGRLRDWRLPDRRPGPSLLRGGRYVYGEPAGTAGPPGEGTATDSASPAFRRWRRWSIPARLDAKRVERRKWRVAAGEPWEWSRSSHAARL